MMVTSVINGHIHIYNDKSGEWDPLLFTPEIAGSGQFGKCIHCNLHPTKEGHDGCLGELNTETVMNACCGHGDNDQAYIQYWDKTCIRGEEAILEQRRLKDELHNTN